MEYEIGDRLRIREWDDMADEFGIKRRGIDVMFGFTPEMRHMCGKLFTVSGKRFSSDGRIKYFSEEGVEDDSTVLEPWLISADMLEYADDRSELYNTDEILEVITQRGIDTDYTDCDFEEICPLCDHVNEYKLSDTKDYKNGKKIVVCQNCGSVIFACNLCDCDGCGKCYIEEGYKF